MLSVNTRLTTNKDSCVTSSSFAVPCLVHGILTCINTRPPSPWRGVGKYLQKFSLLDAPDIRQLKANRSINPRMNEGTRRPDSEKVNTIEIHFKYNCRFKEMQYIIPSSSIIQLIIPEVAGTAAFPGSNGHHDIMTWPLSALGRSAQLFQDHICLMFGSFNMLVLLLPSGFTKISCCWLLAPGTIR